MFRKLFCTLLVGLSLNQATSTYRFHIYANNNQKSAIEESYEYKNELIHAYQDMIVGIDEKQVMNDLASMYNGKIEGYDLYFKLGEGSGEELVGEFKNNYCEVEIKPKSWIVQLFK